MDVIEVVTDGRSEENLGRYAKGVALRVNCLPQKDFLCPEVISSWGIVVEISSTAGTDLAGEAGWMTSMGCTTVRWSV